MLLSNLLFKHDVWHLHKCSGMSVSELLWWCDSPSSCKQGLFFSTPHILVVCFLRNTSVWHGDNILRLHLPFCYCIKIVCIVYLEAGPEDKNLTQLSTWVEWDDVVKGSSAGAARQRWNYFLMMSQRSLPWPWFHAMRRPPNRAFLYPPSVINYLSLHAKLTLGLA